MTAGDGGDAPKNLNFIEDKTPWPLLMVGDPPVYLLAPKDRALGEIMAATRAAHSPSGTSEVDMLKMLLTTAEAGAAAQEAVALARRQGRAEGAAAEREACAALVDSWPLDSEPFGSREFGSRVFEAVAALAARMRARGSK